MTDLHQLQFYATPEHPCSYLPGQQAKTLFVDPKAVVDKADYSTLSDLGFRRSGPHLYRPHCNACKACVSARVNVGRFAPNKTQRRVMRHNTDLSIKITKPHQCPEIYNLYESYINARHADGDMYPASTEQFESFLVNSDQETCFMEFRDQDNLVAIAVIDRLEFGISAIYTFFNPEQKRRSLGTYAILSQIEYAQQQRLPYLYLGYWIHNCRKMTYKVQFQPVELLIDGSWIEIDPCTTTEQESRIKTFDL